MAQAEPVITILKQTFGFSDEDIFYNRSGLLSRKQKRYLKIAERDNLFLIYMDELTVIFLNIFLGGWFISYLWRAFSSTEQKTILYCVLSVPLLASSLTISGMVWRIRRKYALQKSVQKGTLSSAKIRTQDIILDPHWQIFSEERVFKARLTDNQAKIIEFINVNEKDKVWQIFYWTLPEKDFVQILSLELIDDTTVN